MLGKDPLRLRRPVWRSELLVRCQEEILVGPAVLEFENLIRPFS